MLPQIDRLPTLEEVEQRFQQWRKRKTKGPYKKIPDPLIADAVSLLEKYPKSVVCKRLGLPYDRISTKHTTVTSTKSQFDPSQNNTFIPLQVPQPPSLTCQAELLSLNGLTLRLPILNEKQFLQVLQTFMDRT